MKLVRTAGWALLGVVVAAGGLAAWTWRASERVLRGYPLPPTLAIDTPSDAASIALGEHLVVTRGCGGCHGKHLQGDLMWGTAVAPNLPAYARAHDLATFEAALRHGIDHTGRAMYSMPAYNFMRLRDEDVAAIHGWLRTTPVPVSPPLPRARLPWAVRWEMARGRDKPIAGFLDGVPALARQDDPDSRIARGEYLAMTTCIECHGFSLHADFPWPGSEAPDLMITMAYDVDAFTTLLRTGKALGGRELPMMSEVARSRFARLSDEEIADLHAFLEDWAARAAAQ